MRYYRMQKPAAIAADSTLPANPIEIVQTAYSENGWTVIKTAGGQNDLIAQKGSNLHFVHIENNTHAVQRNAFVQNAFSNNARPVFAYVNGKNKSVTFVDVNTNSRVLIKRGCKSKQQL